MSALVRYRDLPGGPTELKFSDELSRFCLCTNCGMLSMSMLKDENEHMFCETCLIEASDKHHREHIYCSFEKKEISIFEMFEANELVTMIRDQYVYCPNTKCKALVTLDELKIHYEQCQPTVTCPTCDQKIQTAEWSKHNEGCNKREVCKASPKGAVPEFRPTCVSSSPRAPPVTMESIWNTKDTCNSLPSSKQLQQTQQPTNDGADKIVLCEHCAKKVKERNMTLHLKACPRVPQLCVYCEKNFSKEDFKSHLTKCNKNPDNVKKEMPKNDKEARKTKPANPPHAPAVNKASKPPASGNTKNDARPRPEVPEATVTTQRPRYGGKKAGGNTANKSTSNGARQNSNGTGPNPATKSSIPRPKGASNSRPGAEQGAVPADTPVWLQCLSSGDILAAFAAFEESFSEKNISEHSMYGEFTIPFVDTKCHEMVKDLLEKASPTQPLDCLMVALFARAALPPKVWAKGKDQVTWNDVFKYLPSILVSRLRENKEVMKYLEKYPVFLGGARPSNVVSRGTQEHPPRASHPSNSTNQASPANDVTDPTANDNDRPDASDSVKVNPLDGGGPTEEKRHALHAEKRTLAQSLATDEVEDSNSDKRPAGKKRRKKSMEARAKNTNALSHRGIRSAKQVSISYQLQPGTDEAGLRSNLPQLDGKPSSKEGSIALDNETASASFKREPIREEKSFEESSTCDALEGLSISEPISHKCQTSTGEATSFPCMKDDHFTDTADNKGTAQKAENARTSVGDAVLGEGREFLTQSDNGHTPSMTCEASEFSKVLNTNCSSTKGGTTQANCCSNAPRVVTLPERRLPAQANESSGSEAPHTKNEAITDLEDRTLETHQKSLPPEQDPNSLGYETRRSEEPLLSGPDNRDFSLTSTNAETVPKAKHTSASVGNSALTEDRESLTEIFQSQEDNTANTTLEESNDLTRLTAISISATGSTMHADHLCDTAPVVSPAEEVLPVQRNNSAEYKTHLTKKELLEEPAHEALNVPPTSLLPGLAPVTATVMPQRTIFQAITTSSDVGAVQPKCETTAPMPRFSHPNHQFRAGYKTLAPKEKIFLYTTSVQQLPGRTTAFESEHAGSKTSCPSSSLASCDERTLIAPAASHHNTYCYGELSQEGVLFKDRYQVGSQTEATASSSESL